MLERIPFRVSSFRNRDLGRFGLRGLGSRVWGFVVYGLGVRASECCRVSRKVDIRLPGKGVSNSHGARPVHLIFKTIKLIRTSRMSIKDSISAGYVALFWRRMSPNWFLGLGFRV
jgi:hypothetical protein